MHGASSSSPPATSVELEQTLYEAVEDLVSDTPEPAWAADVAPPSRGVFSPPDDEVALRELLAATERETVKDLALVRTAAALMNDQPPPSA
ncbi:MAG: hypothetical protein BGO98_24945 [Myxococcales bacterium 68-20]|nr:MAG: hypothetical protein BGO98_24945 [Myxococcales bacterium 68-20]